MLPVILKAWPKVFKKKAPLGPVLMITGVIMAVIGGLGFGVLGKKPGRHIAVLGDMLELGVCTQAEHYRVGRIAAENGISAKFPLWSHPE